MHCPTGNGARIDLMMAAVTWNGNPEALSVPACGCFKHSRPLASCLGIDVLAEVRPEPLTAIMEGQSNWQNRCVTTWNPGPGVLLETS
jgi:hypothetical protein